MAPLSSSPGSTPDRGEPAGPPLPPPALLDQDQLVHRLTELQDTVSGMQRQLTGLLAAVRAAGGGPVPAADAGPEADLQRPPPLYELVLRDFHKTRLAARGGGRSAKNNAQQARTHAGRFCQYLLADLPAHAGGRDLAFLDQVNKVYGYPAYLNLRGYSANTTKKMVNNLGMFLKYVRDSRLRASGLSRTQLSWLVLQIRMAQSQNEV
ncbi:uncharacterized protein LOC103131645 [Poecilia formosa]|uniref:uncharacterized protein LOC103131645 n=1 Tax=Poecilia formosa TaxID=48698 RepID=UPI0007B9D028|nr:PREDICTED: uncharacterized protein LOC103131645 [Poecilia formosa]